MTGLTEVCNSLKFWQWDCRDIHWVTNWHSLMKKL